MTDILTASLPIRDDWWYKVCLAADTELGERGRWAERLRNDVIDRNRAYEEGREFFNMDGGPFFHDTRAQSIITAPCTSITGATTDKLLWPGSLTAVPAGYFVAGKKLRLTAWVAVTSGTTPGNSGIELYVGSADAGGVLVASATVFATVATQSNMPVFIQAFLKCNGGAVETAKPVEGYAVWQAPIALVTAANQQASSPIPIVTPAAVNIDNTVSTLGFNIQMKNSGANANSYVTRDITFEALT